MSNLDIIIQRVREKFNNSTQVISSEKNTIIKIDNEIKCRYIHTLPELLEMCKTINKYEYISFDIETTGLDALLDGIVGVGLAVQANEGYYIPLGHENVYKPQMSEEVVIQHLRPLLEKKWIICHNAKFEYKFCKQHNICLNIGFDTQIAAFIDDETLPCNLKDVARRVLKVEDWSIDVKECHKQPIEKVGNYCIYDTVYTLQLFYYFRPIMDEDYKYLYYKIELPLVEVLAEMELTGCHLNIEYLCSTSKNIETLLNVLKKNVSNLTGKSLNPNSSTQLQSFLFEELKLPIRDYTIKGNAVTDDDALSFLKEEFGKKYPVISMILEYRKLSKWLSAYGRPVLHRHTNLLHNEFVQTFQKTGRISACFPNYLKEKKKSALSFGTIPKNGEAPYSVRKAFLPFPDQMFVTADYKGQELRLLAVVSKDEGMLKILKNGEDLHSITALECFKLPCCLEEVKDHYPKERAMAKSINFGIPYGQSAFGLKDKLECSEKEAQKLIDRYFIKFPNVKEYIRESIEHAHRWGWVLDMSGRKRRFKYIMYNPVYGDTDLFRKIKAEEREAQNFPIQSMGATIIKKALLNCYHYFLKECPDVKIIAARHDEIDFSVPKVRLDWCCQKIKEQMENLDMINLGLNIPMEVEIEVGPNWSELKKWEPKKI